MATVIGVSLGNDSSGKGHGLMIINIFYPGLAGISLIDTVEPDNILRRFGFRVPEEAVTWRQRTKDRDDIVRLRDIAHGLDAGGDILEIYLPIVARYVVDTGHDHHRTGVKVDYVLLETGEHVLDGLTADAPSDIVVRSEESGADVHPEIGDGVAHEYYQRRFGQLGISFGVAVESRPVHGTPVLRLCIRNDRRQDG